ncbi:MAG: hypothetical protein Q7S58_06790 [Candidatus Binatus sp.]|nr:hypothetical protein [Candidatus Binatus sp.]MDO8432104.1 hypothetical protein [Candidatus Binatus sp.]
MAARDAATMLWSRTDLKPADVDVALLYDGFSFLTLVWLEALGFCARGEGGRFIEGGKRIALDGDLPLNTNGGQLSAGRLHGYCLLHEACLQLWVRQVAGPLEVAAAGVGGGPLCGRLLLTRWLALVQSCYAYSVIGAGAMFDHLTGAALSQRSCAPGRA